MKMKTKSTFFALLCTVLLSACQKDFLEKKPNKDLLVPVSLADFKALLDNESVMNVTPALQVISGDELYLTKPTWAALTAVERNSYVWAKDPYEGAVISDWNTPYKQVFYANVILEGMAGKESTTNDEADWNNTKGSALFFRAYAFYNLAQLFAQPMNANTASSSGLPLRLTSDINVRVPRSTVAETYQQIISDLLQAKSLLAPTISVYKTRPSKPAAYAMLARVYLSMGDYPKAGAYADSCLQIVGGLMNYNELDAAKTRPVPRYNKEVIFSSLLISRSFLTRSIRDTTLFKTYSADDLRRKIFFAASGTFKGTYAGGGYVFGGLATDEMWLIRAESKARAGDTDGSITDLNNLLINRFAAGKFIPLTAVSSDEALLLVLQERKKELFFRGLRWTDLRRLNAESAFQNDLHRNLEGEMFNLSPGDNRYILPIPQEEIAASGIPQNPR